MPGAGLSGINGSMRIVPVCCIALLVCASVQAQQIAFQTQTQGGNQPFAYQWRDRDGRTQSMQFVLNVSDIQRGSTEFQGWDDDEAEALAVKQTQRKAAEISSPGLLINVAGVPNGYQASLRGRPGAATQQRANQVQNILSATYNKAITDYAQTHFYRATFRDSGAEKQTIIMPDHVALAKRYTAAMGPVADALRQSVLPAGADERTFINAALSWLQTIPYDTLRSRSTSNGAGYQTPYGLMLGNKGDCDTKATAFLALLRAAYPYLKTAIIYTPNHAFVGIGLPKRDEDFALSTFTGIYVLADPTGPGQQPLGRIDPETQEQLRERHTQVLPL
jgi:hypothetical protein